MILRTSRDQPTHRRGACLLPDQTPSTLAAEDIGTKCYHSKTGAVELLLNHLIDDSRSHVEVDMTAGVDAFASGLFTRFDLTVLVVEPTLRSLGVHQQYVGYAAEHGVAIGVIGNKVEDERDTTFIAEHVGITRIATLTRSGYVRALEKGRCLPLAELEIENRKALGTLQTTVEGLKKDWDVYQRQAVEFHLRNARNWGNAAVGADLAGQIDDGFSLPDAAKALARGSLVRAA